MHPFERHTLLGCLAALTFDGSQMWARHWRTSELSYWVFRHHRALGIALPPTTGAAAEPPDNVAARDAVFRHLTGLRQGRVPQPSTLERKLAWLGDEAGLGELDKAILALLVRLAMVVELHTLELALSSRFIPEREHIPHNADVPVRNLAALLGQSTGTVTRRLSSEKPLRIFGLVEDRCRNEFAAADVTLKVAGAPRASATALRNVLFGTPKSTPLKWDDFSHLSGDAEAVSALLEGATRTKARGVNILLYGAPGTGKTAFASALAARAGLHAIFVGESDEDGDEPTRVQRISALALAQRLASRSEGLLLVVDEAEDIFVGVDDEDGGSRRGAKVFMNNLVEANPCPTLFISNHPGRLGAAVLRRMTYAVEFPALDQGARARIIRRSAARHKLRLGEQDVARLARLDAPPALIDHGLRAARLCAADSRFALRATSSLMKVMGRRGPPGAHAPADFDPAFACADMDLAGLAEKVVASGRTDISLCLSGLPGTGKSAYARHLARCMGLEVVEKRASDLFGMFVGETEQKIAACFEEAREKRAFLIFDEADSLLRERTTAGPAYEVRQVNEMLTWMESHPYPFACTTNFVDGLDPAAARRFLFKVTFLPLGLDQARALFSHTFGRMAPERLDTLAPLTPGDFAVVARKARVMGEHDPGALVEALAAEVAAKPRVARPIGFRALASRP